MTLKMCEKYYNPFVNIIEILQYLFPPCFPEILGGK